MAVPYATSPNARVGAAAQLAFVGSAPYACAQLDAALKAAMAAGPDVALAAIYEQLDNPSSMWRIMVRQQLSALFQRQGRSGAVQLISCLLDVLTGYGAPAGQAMAALQADYTQVVSELVAAGQPVTIEEATPIDPGEVTPPGKPNGFAPPHHVPPAPGGEPGDAAPAGGPLEAAVPILIVAISAGLAAGAVGFLLGRRR